MDKLQNDLKIEVKVDEETALGQYSNFTNISHSPEEFILDFLFVHPAPPPGFGKLISRLILSPGHVKRLLMALRENISQYEERFGEINLSISNDSHGQLQ
jgi:hypothetical protein